VFLRKLTLLNFKNHPQREFFFSKKINSVIGNNGIGKTNVLDAIYYLCLTKSYFSSNDAQNILLGKDFFRLQGFCEQESKSNEIVYKLQSGRKKDLTVNDINIAKMSQHIGQFPVVMIAPDDNLLILGGSEERRRFIDSTISQVNPAYLEWLMQYNKVLAQRNAALKEFAERNTFDKTLLETYNMRLAQLGTNIYEARKIVIEKLQPIFKKMYAELSLERDVVKFTYVSQMHDKPLADLLEENVKRDLILQRTESGIHKDDIDFFMGDQKIKKFGSQGQQKSFVIALKFCEYQFIAEAKGYQPLLLIDDIFDKLDPDRSRQLINMIASDKFGQVFLTDTDERHLCEAMTNMKDFYEIIRLDN
jgi:DNA replication and repair protein RecF